MFPAMFFAFVFFEILVFLILDMHVQNKKSDIW